MTVPHIEFCSDKDAGSRADSGDARNEAGQNIWPGLALTALIAAMAFVVQRFTPLSVLSPIILSIALGFGLRSFVRLPESVRPGAAFSMRKVLRFAIITLGLQLTGSQFSAVGVTGMAIVAATLVATFMFTVLLGGLIGVDRRLSELIAAGTSICGASAVIATNTVTRAPEDVAYAIACVTVFGSIAMFTYPSLPGLLHLDPHAFGLWAGASIHEIAQVVAAAYQDGEAAGEFGTIAKLARVILLAPVVILLGVLTARKARGGERAAASVPRPWFLASLRWSRPTAFSTFPKPHAAK